MKNIFLLITLLIGVTVHNNLHAQAPAIQWQKSLGGTLNESANSIQNTPDGGYIVAGSSESNNGDVTGHHGSTGSKDFWITKLSGTGTLQWQKSLGGSNDDVAYSIQNTSDGGYIVAGFTKSNDGDVSGNHSWESDYWIVKLKSNGDIEWHKTLGGAGPDIARSVEQTKDGGYIVAGYATSNDGDVTGNKSGVAMSDYWIVKLSGSGSIEWQKCLGGYGEEFAYSISQTADAGFIVAGASGSYDGDVVGPKGGGDFWVIKLSGAGALQWQRSFGSTEADVGRSIQQTKDGGFILGGMTRGRNGDVSGWHQSNGGWYYDFWSLKITATGDIEWQKCLGGSGDEYHYSMALTSDDGLLHSGYSTSNDGDVSGNRGGQDFWVVKQNANGDIAWQKSLGGNSRESAYAGIQAADGGYIIAGESSSNDGDVSGNHWGSDFWIVKLAPEPCTPAITINASSMNICSGQTVTFTATTISAGSTPKYQWKINSRNVGTNSNTYTSSTLNNNDTITCELTGSATCGNTTTVVSNRIIMILNSAPVVTISGDSCVGSILTVKTNSPLSSLVWTLNGTTEVSVQKAGANRDGETVAGGNGAGTGANQLNNPARFFIDAAGNIYIPDLTNNRIQKWLSGASSGITVAGGNGAGSALNQLNRPTSVSLDSKGNLYITDQNNNRVMKWAPGATSGVPFGEVHATPTDIFIDPQDNIYVSQQSWSSITRFPAGSTIGGTVFGYTGSGSAQNQLSSPTGIFVDAAGNIYICDTDNNRIQKWTPRNMNAVTVAGGNGWGSAPNQLANPLGVYVDDMANVYVADYKNARVQKWAPGATSGVTVAGGNGVGFAPNQLNHPESVWMNAAGDMFVSDYQNHRIQKFSDKLKETYTTTATGSYTATVTTAAGCTSTSNAIIVSAFKTPQVSITSNTTSVCPGVKPVFTALPVMGGATPSWQWKVNGVAVTGSTSSTFSSANLVNGDQVSCVMTNNDKGCLTSSTASSNSIVMYNIPTEIPLVTIAANDTIVCRGTSIIFTATSVKGGSNPVYQWKINGVNAGSNSPSFTAPFNDGDMISFSMISNLPCVVAAPVTSQGIRVTVDEIPVIQVRRDTTIFLGSTIRLNTEVTGRIDSYRWSSSATQETFNVANPLANPTTTTTYKVTAATAGGCQATTQVTITTITEIKIGNAFSPNNDGINDVWNIAGLSSYADCSVQIFNRFGQLVFQSKGYTKPWNGTLNGKPIPVGTYYYIINTNKTNGQKTGSVTVLR